MMPDSARLTPSQLRRTAIVYVRQSSPSQLERNTESTQRQYALVTRAVELGFAREAVVVIDEDLGISGSGTAERSGFARLTAEVALGRVGLVLGLEVSRLARNNADWYRLLDLCALTDTLIGDGDGLYHPRAFNDRLVLGLKGTMSEAELHTLRARLEGGIRSKAAVGSCAERCRSGWCGARRLARSACIPTSRSVARSARCSGGSPSSAACAPSGCGCARRG
jgi:DNA invertase Pin-like site-specific DNA recombinase